MKNELTRQQTFYREHGYLILEDIIDQDMLLKYTKEIARLHQLAAEYEKIDHPDLSQFQREPFTNDAKNKTLPVLRKIEQTNNFSKLFKELASNPILITTVSNLIGNDLLLYRSTLMLKPAYHGSAHTLHQDVSYWDMEPPNFITVSIFLNNATSENGCFQIIPGSHKWPIRNADQWGTIAQGQNGSSGINSGIDLSEKIEVPLTAGSALVFNSRLVHGSGPNHSSKPRNTALYAYFPPNVVYTPQDSKDHQRSFQVISGLNGQTSMTFTAK